MLVSSRLREVAWVTSGQACVIVGGVANLKIITTLLSPNLFGELALGLALAAGIAILIFGPLSQITLRFYSLCRGNGQLAEYFRWLLSWHLRASLAVMAAAMALSMILNLTGNEGWAIIVFFGACCAVSTGIQGSGLSLLTAMRARKSAAFLQALDPWVRLSLMCMAIAAFGGTSTSALVGYFAGSCIVVFLQIKLIRVHVAPDLKEAASVDRSLSGQFLQYGIPFIGFSLFAVFGQYFDRWFIQAWSTLDMVGGYVVMLQIATVPITAIAGIANQLIVPVVFSRASSNGIRHPSRSGNQLVYATVLVITGFSILLILVAYHWGREIILFFSNEQYAAHASCLWIIVAAAAMYNCAQTFVTCGLSVNQSSVYLAPKIVHALALGVLALVLVPGGAVSGMSWALFGAALTYLFSVVWVNVQLLRAP